MNDIVTDALKYLKSKNAEKLWYFKHIFTITVLKS